MRRKIALWTALAVAGGLLLLMLLYVVDTRRAYARIREGSISIGSAYGMIEYSEWGEGMPVLVIHGGGGGYDQGQIVAETVLGGGFRVIAPSRFGYLRSSMPAGATWDDQAHAFAALLDHLGIDKVAVIALSQGGPSALLLALLHPERVSSLTCLSCGVVTSASEAQADANRKGRMLRTVFSRDFTYWPFSRFFKSQLMSLLGASDSVVARLQPEERQAIERIIEYMNPARPRSAGVVMDNTARFPGERISGIRTPTLVVHAKDDLLQLYHNAEFAARTIPDAQLLSFESGGHVVIAVQRDTIRAAVTRHIRAHADTAKTLD